MKLTSGWCHLDRVSNVEIGAECQIFVVVFFFNCNQVLQSGTQSRYYEGALTRKVKRSFFVICTTFRSDFHVGWKNQDKHSTMNSSFHTLAKWHDPHISNVCFKKTDTARCKNILHTACSVSLFLFF